MLILVADSAEGAARGSRLIPLQQVHAQPVFGNSLHDDEWLHERISETEAELSGLTFLLKDSASRLFAEVFKVA